jgi:hypothetical protein
VSQFLDSCQTHQTFVRDHFIFELAEQIAAASDQAGPVLPSGEQADDFV